MGEDINNIKQYINSIFPNKSEWEAIGTVLKDKVKGRSKTVGYKSESRIVSASDVINKRSLEEAEESRALWLKGQAYVGLSKLSALSGFVSGGAQIKYLTDFINTQDKSDQNIAVASAVLFGAFILLNKYLHDKGVEYKNDAFRVH